MSTEDGPGLRTTLFFKGCPLKCRWCHNPESISPRPHTEWTAVKCIGCGTCLAVCPDKAISSKDGKIVIDFSLCQRCGKCAEECPAGAIEVKGVKMSADEAFAILIKDKAYWGKDGGVTLSGGEALSQSAEAAELLKKLKEAGVHTAVDTCGFCGKKDIDNVYPYTDLFLYDLKLSDELLHKHFTGQGPDIIKENYLYLAEKCKTDGKGLWVRTPVIPGATDCVENIKVLAEFIGDTADKWELCSFNNLCRDKYERLYTEWEFAKTPLVKKQRMEQLAETARKAGVKNVIWSGMTLMEG
ncbi:MAG: glycyl-radical enzyme activating protein [Clostridiales bacterium]|jgi:pyruvate formate lyase activating enzyme|nr:glycyl-radical enzyme activating protein [Clostridiales bacterium]